MNNTIAEFISQTFLVEFGDDVDEDTDLFKEGFIDSFGYVELVTFLEKEFQIKITDEDLLSDSLSSLKKIVELVAGKTNNG